jgi:hypothetical protein
MPAKVRDAVQALGIQSRSILLEVLKAESEEAMIRLVEEAARKNLTRDDLRRRTRQKKPGARRKPYTFKFRAPDRSFRFSLSFRRSDVAPDELISTLEEIVAQLKAEAGSSD